MTGREPVPPPVPFEYRRIMDVAVAAARRSKYRHLGRTLEDGFDCLGLLRWFYAERLDLPFPLPAEARWYSKRFWEDGLDGAYLLGMMRLFAPVEEREVQPGDVVAFRPPKGGSNIGHTGIVVDAGRRRFLHAFFARRGVDVSSWDEAVWKKNLFGFLRHRETGRLVARAPEVSVLLKRAGG